MEGLSPLPSLAPGLRAVLDGLLSAAKTQTLLRRFKQLFPSIPAEVYTAWAGTFAVTPDGLPFIGRAPNHSNAWLALGYGGNGITFSCIAARLIADGILGRENRDAEQFGFERDSGKANAVMPRTAKS